ncbi:MAG TPA: hypothetical protein VG389_11905 [Myxococcota bacterium]|jgi:hypothetical protein|nr:hypothetical protein [Myxococcota bacterium]
MRPRTMRPVLVRALAAGAVAATALAAAPTAALAGHHDDAALAEPPEPRHDPTGLYAGLGVGLTAYVVAPAYGGGPAGNLHLGWRISEIIGLQVTLGGLWLIGHELPGTALASTVDGALRLFVRTSGRWDPYLEGGAGLWAARTGDPVKIYRALGFFAGIGHEVHISNFTIGMHARYVGVAMAKSTDPADDVRGHGALIEGELYSAVRF